MTNPNTEAEARDWSERPVGSCGPGTLVWEWMDAAEREIYRLQTRVSEANQLLSETAKAIEFFSGIAPEATKEFLGRVNQWRGQKE